jgi:hypothetical protein
VWKQALGRSLNQLVDLVDLAIPQAFACARMASTSVSAFKHFHQARRTVHCRILEITFHPVRVLDRDVVCGIGELEIVLFGEFPEGRSSFASRKNCPGLARLRMRV